MDIETDEKRASGHYDFFKHDPVEPPASAKIHVKLRDAAETAAREYAVRLRESASKTLPIVEKEIAARLEELAALRSQEVLLYEDLGRDPPEVVEVETLRSRVADLEAAARISIDFPTWGIDQVVREAVKAHLDERARGDD